MIEFRLPDVGEGLHEAQIGAWLVAVGDVVKLDQPLLEVETDKSVVELPSPAVGRIVKLGFETGQMATVGDLLVVIEPEMGRGQTRTNADEAVEAAKPLASGNLPRATVGMAGPGERILAAPSVRQLALAKGVDLTAVRGSGPAGRILASDVEAVIGKQLSVISNQLSVDQSPIANPQSPIATSQILAAPAVRKMAQERGIDLAQVVGSAENGRITPADVEQFVAVGQEEETAVSSPLPPRSSASLLPTAAQRTPLRGIRRTMALRMQESWQTIPHVTNFEEIDATELMAVRGVLKEAGAARGVSVTYLPIVAKILTQVLQLYPDFNASIDMETMEVVHHPACHLGIATATDDGLLVPVLRDAGQLTIFEMATQINDLVTQARARKLPREALTGSTFTITNFGIFGNSIGTPIINPPEVAILGMGRIAEKPVVVAGALAVRPVLPLALSFDHRLIDGAAAGAFLRRLRQLLERPQELLLDLR
ncbi:MAG: 2-oxo acid dehydrogenase subunit E2 [Ardenticatenaceae bacterium]|nr:2-oxo acid dehydrogenase subunit E2 [Ardenticatenaceae bacterium]